METLYNKFPKKKNKFATLNILGTEYSVYMQTAKEDPGLENLAGYCAYGRKHIVVDQNQPFSFQVHILKHEIVHAMLHESGLSEQSPNGWAVNEEIVDWIAHQVFKIGNVCDEAIKALNKLYDEKIKEEKEKNKK